MSNNDRFRFRAWNKEKNIYHYGVENTYDYMYGSPAVMKCSFGSLLEDTGDGNRYVVEQCTGLKDKNGRLIYEGDIVLTDEDGYGHIRWDNELAQFFVATEEHYTFDNIFSSEMEVIGNIHENPELLGAEK